jgi:beta-glucosidase
MTFPRAVGQVPIHYDHERTGRPPRVGGAMLAGDFTDFTGPNNTDDYYTSKYLDLPLGPRFDFGHGLSYTSFALESLEVSPRVVRADEVDVVVSVTVRNTGDRDGDDVVMLFVTDEVASLTQPVRRLRGFRRIPLAAGAAERLEFPLGVDDLSFWADGSTRVLEPGDFTIAVGDGVSGVSASLRVEAAR